MINTSKLDTNRYEHMILENGTRVILVSNDSFTNGSVCATMDVGSYNESDGFEGLAHFCEHMLFMGTKKYPRENFFMEFVNKYGGNTNAFTANEKTTYLSEVKHSEFEMLVDIFAQFFIHPNFSRDGIDREVNAVNSEYLFSLKKPDFYQEGLLGEFVKKGQKLGIFNCGNSETLNRPGVYERMLEFYNNWYSSDRLSVVLSGPFSLDKLKSMAQVFQDVPRRKVLNYEFSHHLDCFESSYKGTLIKAKSVDDLNKLIIYFNIPSLYNYVEENPSLVFHDELTKISRGSLYSTLIRLGLGNSVSLSTDTNMGFSLISFTVYLTEKGKENYLEVLSLVYEHFSTLDISKSMYDTIAKRYRQDFLYEQNMSQLDLTTELSNRMSSYPLKDLLSCYYLANKYDEKLMKSIHQSFLNYREWLVVFYSSDGSFDTTEYYYNVPYTCLGKLPALESPVHDFHPVYLPASSVIDKCNYLRYEVNDCKVLHVCEGESRPWSQPKVFYTFRLLCPDIVTNKAAYNLLVMMLQYRQEEKWHDELEDSRSSLHFSYDLDGLYFEFSGFSSFSFSEIIADTFNVLKSIENDTFGVFKEELIALHTKNINMPPFNRSGSVFQQSRIQGFLSDEEYLEQIVKLEFSDLPLGRGYQMSLFVIGNVNRYAVEEILQKISLPTFRGAVELKSDAFPSTVSFRTFDCSNNVYDRFYAVKDSDAARALLFSHIISEKFFDQLRTKETLGYVVKLLFYTKRNDHFVRLILQGVAEIGFMRKRFDDFIAVEAVKFMKEVVEDEDFEEFRDGLISLLKTPFPSLCKFNEFIIQSELNYGDIHFNEKMVEEISKLTPDDFNSLDFLGDASEVFSYRVTDSKLDN